MGNAPLPDVERARELLVRRAQCPVCHAQPGERCRYDDNKARGCYAQPTSHTGRYHIAAELGLVPPLGVRHG